jgi:hypothetical protein
MSMSHLDHGTEDGSDYSIDIAIYLAYLDKMESSAANHSVVTDTASAA